jgi:solute carrier family 25 citrate transporter 1
MEACCLQPIDVVKTRLQLDRSGAYRGIAHCGTTVARAEGVRALWKGLTPFATHLTLKYALRLGSNAVLQSAFKDPTTGKVSAHGRLASGFGAGVIEALLIVTPFEARSCFSLPQTVLLQSSYLGCVGHAYSLYGSHKNRLPHRQKSIIL